MEVIDVTTKSTFQVPREHITFTSAIQNDTKSFPLCELYQRGKCDKGDSCKHIHVDPRFLKVQREKHYSWMQSNAEKFAEMSDDKTFDVFNATIKEVMAVQKCNLEYTRGLFLSPEDRDKRTTGNNSYSGKVPTACLLFLNGSCKWGEHCNQAHINRRYLTSKNREFQKWMDSRKSEFSSMSPGDYIEAYHPNVSDVIKIPKSQVTQFTRGLYQYVQGSDKIPSICLLFQKNRCSCEELCKQVHVSPEWLNKQRKNSRKSKREVPSPAKTKDNQKETNNNPSPSCSSFSSVSPSSFTSFSDSPGCSSMGSISTSTPVNHSFSSPNKESPNEQTAQSPNSPNVSRPLNLDLSPSPKDAPKKKLNVDAKPFNPNYSKPEMGMTPPSILAPLVPVYLPVPYYPLGAPQLLIPCPTENRLPTELTAMTVPLITNGPGTNTDSIRTTFAPLSLEDSKLCIENSRRSPEDGDEFFTFDFAKEFGEFTDNGSPEKWKIIDNGSPSPPLTDPLTELIQSQISPQPQDSNKQSQVQDIAATQLRRSLEEALKILHRHQNEVQTTTNQLETVLTSMEHMSPRSKLNGCAQLEAGLPVVEKLVLQLQKAFTNITPP